MKGHEKPNDQENIRIRDLQSDLQEDSYLLSSKNMLLTPHLTIAKLLIYKNLVFNGNDEMDLKSVFYVRKLQNHVSSNSL